MIAFLRVHLDFLFADRPKVGIFAQAAIKRSGQLSDLVIVSPLVGSIQRIGKKRFTIHGSGRTQ
jgi:hypothetical protein